MDEEHSQIGGAERGTIRTRKGTERARGTHVLLSTEGATGQDTEETRASGAHQLGGTMGRNDARRSYALESQWDEQSGYQKKASTTSRTHVLLRKGGTSHDVERASSRHSLSGEHEGRTSQDTEGRP